MPFISKEMVQAEHERAAQQAQEHDEAVFCAVGDYNRQRAQAEQAVTLGASIAADAAANGVRVETWTMDRMLTTAEVAAILRVDVETVREMVRRGELAAAEIGRGWKFHARDVVELVDRRMDALRERYAGGDV